MKTKFEKSLKILLGTIGAIALMSTINLTSVRASEILHLSNPLSQAIVDGNLEIVHALLVRGLGINVRESNGGTPLHFAAEKGHLEVVRELVAKGANINAKLINGCTPLHIAAGMVTWE